MAFKKYSLSEEELTKIARLCYQEQGSGEGAKAEASLAANLLETHSNYQKKYGDDIYSFMRNSGWFYNAAYFMDKGTAPTSAIEGARLVLCEAQRALPLGVDEHDCFSDIKSASNDGIEFDKRSRSSYVRHKTRIINTLGSSYTFYSFPTKYSDPFGYTDENRKYMDFPEDDEGEEEDEHMVIIGSARMDENGKAIGGQAGDQTGKEVSTQEWYLHSKGWVTIRAKDDSVMEKIAYAMQRACDNQNIGYGQDDRDSAYNWCEAHGDFDPGNITEPVETDCSALVRLCLAYAGIFVDDFYTGNASDVIMATGAFRKLTAAKYTAISDNLRRGDIQITAKKGHTIVILSNGKNIVSESSDNGNEDAESNANDNTESNTDNIADRIAFGQTESIKFTGNEIEVDGIYGKQTRRNAILCIQRAINLDYGCGIEEDGIWGPETEDAISGHYVKYGETQYLVTALEIIMYLHGKNPNGVEYPGEFGSGLKSAIGMVYVDAETFKTLIS